MFWSDTLLKSSDSLSWQCPFSYSSHTASSKPDCVSELGSFPGFTICSLCVLFKTIHCFPAALFPTGLSVDVLEDGHCAGMCNSQLITSWWTSFLILGPRRVNIAQEHLRVYLEQTAYARGQSLSRVWLFATPWTAAYQAPLSMGFSKQECWSGLPFPSAGDLPDPGIEPGSPTLQEDALPSEPPGKLKRLGYAIPNVEIFHLWDMENFQ